MESHKERPPNPGPWLNALVQDLENGQVIEQYIPLGVPNQSWIV